MSPRRALDAMSAVLPSGLDIEVAGQQGRDLLVQVAGQELRLRWLEVGWPRQIAEALREWPPPDVIAAPRLSPGARELARSEGVGWLDETGAAEMHSGLLVVSRTGDRSAQPRARSAWRPATLAVCEVLLTGCPPTVSAVAGATGLAPSTAVEALQVLTRDGLLSAEVARGPRSRRSVADPDQLIDAYAAEAEQLRPPLSLRVGSLWRDPLAGITEAGRAWRAADVRWAVTSALSAAVLAPVLTLITPLEVYVSGRTHGDLRRAAGRAGLSEIEGGRLLLRPFPTPANGKVTTEIRPGVMSVLWPRAYADLRLAGVRGEDAAEHLREEMSDG
jgi:hypothetical protein